MVVECPELGFKVENKAYIFIGSAMGHKSDCVKDQQSAEKKQKAKPQDFPHKVKRPQEHRWEEGEKQSYCRGVRGFFPVAQCTILDEARARIGIAACGRSIAIGEDR
jgi:hypothetical protein